MTVFSCRAARPEDYPLICTFPQNAQELFYMYPAGKFPLTPEQLAAAVKERWKPTVVLADGEVAGYANLYGLVEQAECYLGNVIVAAAYRSRGAASELIGRMITQARDELNVPKLKLVCHHTNMPALLFYKKLGFRPFDLRTMKGLAGETVVGLLMEMDLSRSE
ncbi:GNAT family N-acetyltransferase [Paenibacillus oryzisoli]|uniref:GNAT family N-acetyltransferase n=1 Tax=Paenibacillus oryzisoli TaxID=1850517 RepID=UPI003D27AAC2